MRHTAPAPRAGLVRLVLCFSLLAQALMPAPARASASRDTVKSATLVGGAAARQGTEAAGLPDLDEARSRPRHEPKAVPPVPSTRRRCPPRNPRCNDDVDGAGRPAPTPTPAANPRRAAQAGAGENLLAGFAGRSLMTLMTAALGGRRPLVDVDALDFYKGGASSVSDSAPASALAAPPAYAAAPAPAPVFQSQDTPQPFVTGMTLGALRTDSPGWAGFRMTTGAQPLTLTSLGRLCSPGNSLLHELRLIRAADNVVVASTGVSMSGCAVNQFRYESLSSPVTLAANTSYLVVSYEAGGDAFHDWTGTALTTTSAATVSHGVYTTNGGQTWGAAGSTGSSYVPVGFEYKAGTPSVAFVTGRTVGAMRADSPGWAGFRMTTGATPLAVSSLGRLCLPGNSLSHDLRLVRVADNATVATAAVAMAGCAGGQFKYAPLTSPVTLAANTSYLLVSYEVGADAFHDWTGTALATTPAAMVNHAVYTTNGGQTWGAAGSTGSSYVPLDFKYQTDEQGTGTGLTARYYDGLNFDTYRLTRPDAAVDFNWGGGSPAAAVAADQFSARWTGMVSPRYTQTYTFYTTTDDGVRLWVDQKLIIDKWVDQGPTQWGGQVALEAGRLYDIRVEFYENTGGASAKLEWQSASQVREVVPRSRLYGCWKATGEFVKEFYQAALARQPNAAELSDWSSRLAQAQGETQLVEEARALGVALFDLSPASAYTARGRSNGDFVADLYRGYLQRDPDQDGWSYWLGKVGEGRANIREAFAQSPEFVEKVKRLCGVSAGADANAGAGYNFASARLDPNNRTGGGGADAYSRNYNFQIPLVSLAGRAGLDLGLTLSYNSLVWTKDATGVAFDADEGFPGPGFRLGFPTIQPKFVNPQLQQAGQPARHSYLLLTPAGERVELRQTATAGVYESADSSYLQLAESGGVPHTLRATDGTQLSFILLNGSYRCHEVRDRNGNYLSVSYWGDGRLNVVTDTLGRTITFNYDQFQNLVSITQPWRRETEANPNPAQDEAHVWATFGYTNLTLQPQFLDLAVMGEQPGAVIPVLNQLGLADGSYFRFEYNGWGQVWKTTHYAADAVGANNQPNFTHALNATRLDLPGSDLVTASPRDDCPRFTQERVWVENGVMNHDGEAVTSYSPWAPNAASCEVTAPDGKVKTVETYAAAGWRRGMTTQSQVWATNGTPGAWEVKKTTAAAFEHDGAADATYPSNPRVTETTATDPQGNGRTTRVTYTTPADFRVNNGYAGTLNLRLPRKVEECTAGCSQVLRTTVTDYSVPNLGQYAALRIFGLARYRKFYEGAEDPANLRSQSEYVYDEANDPSDPQNKFLAALPSPAAQHDAAVYGHEPQQGGLRWRGNPNRARRYSVDQQTGAVGSYVESRAGFNVTGAAAYAKDAVGHKTSVSYADAFFQNVNRTHPNPQLGLQTYAYPTTFTDPDGFTTSHWYNYDMGAVTKTRTPEPGQAQNTTNGPAVTRLYDAAGRPVKAANSFNGAHAETVYDPSMRLVKTYRTVSEDSVQTPANRLYAVTALDGLGRARGEARDFTGSTGPAPAGNYSARITDYDVMGRVVFRSHPTEMRVANGSWTPAGDDANGGVWKGESYTYDWKGRPRKVVNADGSDRLFDYGGCGCAGGEVVTVKGELVPTNEPSPAPAFARRTQRTYHDALGRPVKTEALNWGGTVYATTTTNFDAFDRETVVRRYQGTEQSGVYREATRAYDGYGRLEESHAPGQDAGRSTRYAYKADDTIESVTDARGVKTVYGYNNGRHLVTSVSYDLSNVIEAQNVQASTGVTFQYDAAGNRTQMTDGAGGVGYTYDPLSRLTSETRQFAGLTGGQTLTYAYNLADQLKSITDPFSDRIDYKFDQSGRVTEVTGTPYTLSGAGGNHVVTRYATELKHRAWGAIKSLTYGNDLKLAQEFDDMLRPQSFKVDNATNIPHAAMSASFLYYADGQLRFASADLDHKFDRAFAYDAQSRVAEAYTGGEARNFAAGAAGGTTDGPYRQSYRYDAWSNLTRRDNRYWSETATFEAGYDQRNRRQVSFWQHDAEGHALRDSYTDNVYDAAGLNVEADNNRLRVTQSYDGDGRAVKRVERRYDDNGVLVGTETARYVHSTVLGGALISELDGGGHKVRSKIYLGGKELAEQRAAEVVWRHENPLTGNRGASSPGGTYLVTEESEPDAGGVDAGKSNPYAGGVVVVPPNDGMATLLGGAFGADECLYNGIGMDCADVLMMAANGSAVADPSKPITIVFVHIIPFEGPSQPNSMGSVRIGNMGGPDSSIDPGYRHTHIVFLKAILPVISYRCNGDPRRTTGLIPACPPSRTPTSSWRSTTGRSRGRTRRGSRRRWRSSSSCRPPSR
jgi:YD repeat-containing protein